MRRVVAMIALTSIFLNSCHFRSERRLVRAIEDFWCAESSQPLLNELIEAKQIYGGPENLRTPTETEEVRLKAAWNALLERLYEHTVQGPLTGPMVQRLLEEGEVQRALMKEMKWSPREGCKSEVVSYPPFTGEVISQFQSYLAVRDIRHELPPNKSLKPTKPAQGDR